MLWRRQDWRTEERVEEDIERISIAVVMGGDEDFEERNVGLPVHV